MPIMHCTGLRYSLAIALALGLISASAYALSPAVSLTSAPPQPGVLEAQTVPDWLGPLDFPKPPSEDDVFNDPGTPVLGNPSGDVSVVEYFDYHCPYCKVVAPDLMRLIEEDPGVRLVLKDYPILSEDSVAAAKAALAAAKQGRYREMHEALMAYNGSFTRSAIEEIATGVNVDPTRLFADMDSPEIQAQIQRHLDQGKGLGMRGTPGFIFGRKQVPGAISLDDMRKLVAEARRKK
jgi:protein-disulfide isomerase